MRVKVYLAYNFDVPYNLVWETLRLEEKSLCGANEFININYAISLSSMLTITEIDFFLLLSRRRVITL